MIGKILGFLFGKGPQIFNEKGQIQHKLPKNSWENWKNTYLTDDSYNWRNHKGTERGKSSK